MKALFMAAAVAALAAGCAPMDRQAANQAALADARPVGEPRDCVPLAQISHTRVLSAGVIDFHLRSGEVYRNTLPASCPGLGFEQRFSYKTSLSRLCSVDLITVLYPSGPTQGATCGLGPFQRIETSAR